jgi:hypothetical protein
MPLERGYKKMDGRFAGVCFLLALLLLGSHVCAGMLSFFLSQYDIAIAVLYKIFVKFFAWRMPSPFLSRLLFFW